MKLTPTNDASQRTKNRLREHQNLAIVRHGTPQVFDNADCMLVECEDCDWHGWLPVAEVETPGMRYLKTVTEDRELTSEDQNIIGMLLNKP